MIFGKVGIWFGCQLGNTAFAFGAYLIGAKVFDMSYDAAMAVALVLQFSGMQIAGENAKKWSKAAEGCANAGK